MSFISDNTHSSTETVSVHSEWNLFNCDSDAVFFAFVFSNKRRVQVFKNYRALSVLTSSIVPF